MAVVIGTLTQTKTTNDHYHTTVWTTLLNGDTGSPLSLVGSADRSVQINGTFGAGGTIIIEGSNDGVNYVILTDPQGNTLSKTAAAIEAVLELTKWIRPRVSAGDGTTSLTVTLIARKS